MGKIMLEGMEFYAFHGFHPEERKIGNKYSVDLELEVDFNKAVDTDDLKETIDYEMIYAEVNKVMGKPSKLLEHVAGEIIQGVRSKFPQTKRITAKVSKFNPPIKGVCHKASVEISV